MRYYYLVMTILACVACGQQKKESAPLQTNIILIMADDMGFETLGVYGSTDYQTPHLDQLAAEGMRFDSCYSTPLCTPSRIQLMTGKYNFRNYVGFGILDSTERTFGHLMQEAGYKTAVVGKWQLYGNARQYELAGQHGSWPQQAGFDEYCLWQIDQRGSRFKDPLLFMNQREPQTFKDEFGPDIFCQYIEDYLERNQNEAFFLYYPMVLTHDPFQPTPMNDEFEAFDVAERVNDTTYFRDFVSYTDKIVGKITAKLKSLNLHERTLLIFIGDNGTDRDVVSNWRGQRIRGNKGYPTEYGTHVPGIAWWPGTVQPAINNHLVDFTDWLPTIMETADAEIPKGFHTDGISLLGQLTGQENAPVREWVFGSYAPVWGNFVPRTYVHDHEYKLDMEGKFFRFVDDVAEEHPISEADMSEEEKERRDRLQEVLDKMKE